MDPQLFSWILSIMGGLFAFVAIFTALETFYVQDWLGKSSSADAAYNKVKKLQRNKDHSLSDDDDRTLQGSRSRIGDAVTLFPGVLVGFFAVVGLATTAISMYFYSAVSSVVGTGTLYWAGGLALGLLFGAIFVVAVYSFIRLWRIKTRSKEVEEFAMNHGHTTLADARAKLVQDRQNAREELS